MSRRRILTDDDLAQLRGAIRDVLYECIPGAGRAQLLALGHLHRVDADTLLAAGVPLPPNRSPSDATDAANRRAARIAAREGGDGE